MLKHSSCTSGEHNYLLHCMAKTSHLCSNECIFQDIQHVLRGLQQCVCQCGILVQKGDEVHWHAIVLIQVAQQQDLCQLLFHIKGKQ